MWCELTIRSPILPLVAEMEALVKYCETPMFEQVVVDKTELLVEGFDTAKAAEREVVEALADTTMSLVIVCTAVPLHVSFPLSGIEKAVPPTVNVPLRT